MFGLGETDGALPLLPLTAFLHQFNAFKSFENGALAAHSAGSFETGMLGHNLMCVKKVRLSAHAG